MITTRRYISADRDRVIAMARAFHRESPVHRDVPFVEEKVVILIERARHDLDWLALLAEDGEGELVGFALMTVQEPYYSTALELMDLAIYVAKDRRGAAAFRLMMIVIESWGRARGATRSSIGINTGIDHDRALSSFMKLGYRPSGISVVRDL